MIVTVGGSKGGVGKTTLVINFAVQFQSRGYSVVIFDTDPERQAELWTQQRTAAGLPPIDCVTVDYSAPDYSPDAIAGQILDLSEQYDVVLVDVAGRYSVEQLKAVSVSDMLLVATRPGSFELNSLHNMDEALQAIHSANPEIAVKILVTHASTHFGDSRAMEFAGIVEGLFDDYEVVGTRLGFRSIYADATASGMSVSEDVNAKARREIERAFDDVFAGYGVRSGV